MQITEIFHIIHEPFAIPYLKLQILLQLALLKGDQVLAFYFILVEDLTIGLHLYGFKKVKDLFHAPFLQILGDER